MQSKIIVQNIALLNFFNDDLLVVYITVETWINYDYNKIYSVWKTYDHNKLTYFPTL